MVTINTNKPANVNLGQAAGPSALEQHVMGLPDTDPMKIEFLRLKNENQKLKTNKVVGGQISIKVLPVTDQIDPKTKRATGKKQGGGLCYYGLQRFPFTFRANQAVKLFNPRIILAGLEEMDKNLASMTFKGDDGEQEVGQEVVRAELDTLLAIYRGVVAKLPKQEK